MSQTGQHEPLQGSCCPVWDMQHIFAVAEFLYTCTTSGYIGNSLKMQNPFTKVSRLVLTPHINSHIHTCTCTCIGLWRHHNGYNYALSPTLGILSDIETWCVFDLHSFYSTKFKNTYRDTGHTVHRTYMYMYRLPHSQAYEANM